MEEACNCEGVKCSMSINDPRHGTNSSYTNRGCRCDACREGMRQYQADYYQKNVDQLKQKSRTYYHDNPERVAEYHRERYEKNSERIKAQKHDYYERNSEAIKSSTAAWKRANPEREREYGKKWRDKPENKAVQRASVQRRYARKKNADCGCVTGDTYAAVLALHYGRCAYCEDGSAEAFDHVVPLDNGGRNCVSNGLPTCRVCNSSKGVKDLATWLQETSRTLQYVGERLTCPL